MSQRPRLGLGRPAVALVLGTLLVGTGAPMASAHDAAGHSAVSAQTAVAPTILPAGDMTDIAVQQYVESVYLDLFDRAPDPQGLATWTAALQSGTPRVAVANAITSSEEFRGNLITGSYDWYLGRTPDADGLRFWLDQMAAGYTISQMEAGFIGSPEYYDLAGSTDDGWVTTLYTDVLERSAAPSEVTWWTQALDNGMSRQGVSLGFLLSTEHLSTVVDSYYQYLLDRGLDPSGQAYWVDILQRGGRDEAIIGGIIASDEYWDIATATP